MNFRDIMLAVAVVTIVTLATAGMLTVVDNGMSNWYILEWGGYGN
jgi:hypothetical protein